MNSDNVAAIAMLAESEAASFKASVAKVTETADIKSASLAFKAAKGHFRVMELLGQALAKAAKVYGTEA